MTRTSTAGNGPRANIILIGMAGSGKSSIGRCLAEAMSLGFTDTDSLMERSAGIPLQEIIQARGLDGFRRLEEEILLQVNLAGHVIATGGSSVYSRRGMLHLKQNGTVIFLDVTPALLQKRIRNFHSRGLVRLPEQSFTDLYAERMPLYRQYADQIFSCGKMNKQEVCRRLTRLLQQRLVSEP